MRRPILAANWKMHKTSAEARAFAAAFVPLVADATRTVEVVIAPPFTAVAALGPALAGSRIALAAQNVPPETHGAYTGEVAAAMLRELGCTYCIIGHSERRTLFGETSAFVARKAAALLREGMRPILCVGESLEGLPSERAAELVLAYEPIWAIGTGKTATPSMAQEVHGHIRARLRERYGAAADAIRIQYGGSVKPENAAELMAQPDIDGALVGGASLEPESFARIVRFERKGTE